MKLLLLKKIAVNLMIYSVILAFAYLLNKMLEITIAIITFSLIRDSFPKTFHSNTIEKDPQKAIFLCLNITVVVYCLIQPALVKVNISILWNVFIGMMLGLLAYIVQDYLERYMSKKIKDRRSKILDILNNKNNEDAINEYCKSRGLKKEVAETVNLFLNNTIEEVCDKLYITSQTLDYRIKKFIESK